MTRGDQVFYTRPAEEGGETVVATVDSISVAGMAEIHFKVARHVTLWRHVALSVLRPAAGTIAAAANEGSTAS